MRLLALPDRCTMLELPHSRSMSPTNQTSGYNYTLCLSSNENSANGLFSTNQTTGNLAQNTSLVSDKYQLDVLYLRRVSTAIYLITFIFGIIGNSLVMYVIGRFTKVRVKSVANYYILNLAIADEFLLLTLPFFIYATYTQNWVFGDFGCKLSTVAREMNKFTSVFTLVALSIDR